MNPYAKHPATAVSTGDPRRRRPLSALSTTTSGSTTSGLHPPKPTTSQKTTTTTNAPLPTPRTALELLQLERQATNNENQLSWLEWEEDTQQHPTATAPTPPTSNQNPRTIEPWLRLWPGVVELSGPGGAGKTQLALSVCLGVARHAHNCIYLCLSNHDQTVSRLQQMGHAENVLLDCIWMRECSNLDDFLTVLNELEETVLHTVQPRVLVIDSIADVFRHVYEDNHIQRSIQLFGVAEQLQKFVHHSSPTALTIICVNQVTADFGGATSNSWSPALGLSWAHCTRTKFRLDRCPAWSQASSSSSSTARTLSLYHSPRFAPSSVQFTIQSDGCKRPIIN